MKVITQRELIQSVADRWHAQYQPFTHDSAPWTIGKTKSGIWRELVALNKDEATTQEVDTIIGNKSWTRMMCDQCEQDADSVIQVGAALDYESATAHLCRSCLQSAYELMLKS